MDTGRSGPATLNVRTKTATNDKKSIKGLAMIIFSGLMIAEAQTPSEHKLKAAFIYNFAKFVERPSRAGDDPKLPIVIGILGNDPFGRDIDEVINGKTANGRNLVIKRSSHVKDFALGNPFQKAPGSYSPTTGSSVASFAAYSLP